MEKPRRNPLDKEKFLEGNRSRFTIILMGCMFVLLWATIQFNIQVDSFLTFLTFIGSFYLGGASLTAWTSANKTQTFNQNINQNSTVEETITTKKEVIIDKQEDVNIETTHTENYTANIKIEGENGPETKPYSQLANKE